MNQKKKHKKEYEAPEIEAVLIRMGQGVVTGSVAVSPLDAANGTVKDQWGTEDQSGGIDW